jgi:hypothetical protein
MHTRAAGEQAGGWNDWKKSKSVPTIDFFKRIVMLRKSYAAVPICTALKFNSADRIDSYKRKDASEQRSWALRMKNEPRLREIEVMTALACAWLREEPPRLKMPKKTGKEPDGWEIEIYRRARGLDSILDIPELGEVTTTTGKISRINVSKSNLRFIDFGAK